MIDLRDARPYSIALTGKFPDLSKAEIEILLQARGSGHVMGAPSKYSTLLIADTPDGKKQDKARELGQPILLGEDLRAALGEPLEGYRERFERAVAERPNYYSNVYFHIGDPAPAETLARVEEKLGRPLPLAAKNLFSQLDGLSYLWTIPDMKAPREGLMGWADMMDSGGELYSSLVNFQQKNKTRFGMGCVNIPTVETIFFTEWEGRLFSSDHYGPKDKIKVGKQKVGARAFFDNLFLLDGFHFYYQAGLWADPESGELFVVYGSDHGADWLWSTPLPFEIYMEYVLWEFGSNRIIQPASKLGMTRAMCRVHPRSWTQLEPYRAL
ncbi:MAG: hypothetical protein H6741_25775 [Alphaproteobacteria bacterium]|nr:hypothetical protein [Alphaproteobacteria bacterium]MCB9796121.1 hypothetical protein [Alphaproteobacteria bacterium]